MWIIIELSFEGTYHGSGVQCWEHQFGGIPIEFKSHHLSSICGSITYILSSFWDSVSLHLGNGIKWVSMNHFSTCFHLFSFCFKYVYFLLFCQEPGTGNVALFLEYRNTQTFSCLLSLKPLLRSFQSANWKWKTDFYCIITYSRAMRDSSSSSRALLMEWTGEWSLLPITESFIYWRPDGL